MNEAAPFDLTGAVPVNGPVPRIDARAPVVIFIGLAGVAGIAALLRARRRAAARDAPRATARTAPTPGATIGRAAEAVRSLGAIPGPSPRFLLRTSAALLGAAVLTDSAIEHYRGSFRNPAMYAPLAASGLLILMSVGALGSGREGLRAGRDTVHIATAAVGAAGLGFHLYNIGKRPGGYCWLNFFYAAPFGAPAALSLAAAIGFSADRLDDSQSILGQRLLGMPFGQAMAGIVGFGLAGTVAEVTLLHFRGAFHNPFMWLPVALPPVSSALMARAVISPDREQTLSRAWLWTTALVGLGGMGFHAYGVSRNMGGWRNWSQNLLAGPPLPAPPSFSALALAGIASLDLIALERGQAE